MTEIVQIENEQVTTTSRIVAEQFEKNHRDILRVIDNVIEGLRNIAQGQEADEWFTETTYVHEKNHQTYRMFNITKNGFVLLAGGFTDKKFMEFKVKYIKQFDLMEETLREQYSQQFFITEDAEQQAKRIKLENSTMNSQSRNANALFRWYKEAQKNGDVEMQEVMRAQVMEMYPGRKSTTPAIEMVSTDSSEYSLSATNIANRYGNGVTPEEVGAVANALGLGKNERIQTGSGLAKKYLYNDKGVQAIVAFLNKQTTLEV